MRKAATQKTAAPINLGTKRACTKCGTKFYDMGKAVQCPKCRHKLSPEELDANRIFQEAKKKPEKVPPKSLADEEETTVDSGDSFESAEDLDSNDDVRDDVDVDADDDDDDKDQY